MDPKTTVEALSGADLLTRTRELAQESRRLDAELLLHLDEIVTRKLTVEGTLFAAERRQKNLAPREASSGKEPPRRRSSSSRDGATGGGARHVVRNPTRSGTS